MTYFGISINLNGDSISLFISNTFPMTKQDLVSAMADASGISKAAAERALNAFITAISKSLKKGEKVTLTGFGTFSISNRAARTGRNPRTGASIKIAASKSPKFKAGKGLKDAVK